MNLWQWLARKFPYAPRGARAQSHLASAYRRVFEPGAGASSDEDRQIVLADLSSFTGFYRVSGPGLSAEDRAFADGMRAAYGRIYRFLRMTDDEVRSLEEAARQEAITDALLGEE